MTRLDDVKTTLEPRDIVTIHGLESQTGEILQVRGAQDLYQVQMERSKERKWLSLSSIQAVRLALYWGKSVGFPQYLP